MAGVELLPREYGYVVLVLVFYCFINFWMTAQVGRARKKYNVSYPTLYASEADNKDAKLFNCIQLVNAYLFRCIVLSVFVCAEGAPEFTGNAAHVDDSGRNQAPHWELFTASLEFSTLKACPSGK
ncbi:hypothetical protein SASPL_135548 [Salvia splendens]|uniref:Uncharacterized protein n=1 Tax=Salvia splendens TaxID=180675 RepID=A0A8X8ZFT6_SALSN|nr:hypothetical protein SASPL_135548 [Salvia splendens]